MRQFKYDCPENMKPFIEQVLDGEYDVLKNNQHAFKFRLLPSHILDIGANIGAFSYWAFQMFPGVKIDAYEPNPTNVGLYAKHLEESGVPEYVYNIHRVAVTTRPEPLVKLYEGAYNCGMHSMDIALAGQENSTFEAPSLHPDKLPETDFLKADTEGCEVEILNSYLSTHRKPSLVSYEYHKVEDRTALEDIMRSDYVLCSGAIFYVNLGVCNWLHKRHFEGKPND